MLTSLHSFCQTDPLLDSLLGKKTAPNPVIPKPVKKIDSSIKEAIRQNNIAGDSLLNPVNDSADLSALDSLQKDSSKNISAINIPSKIPLPVKYLSWEQDIAFSSLFKISLIKVTTGGVFFVEEARMRPPKDILFYTFIALFFFLAVIKTGFPKYYGTIFRSFFQVSFRQKQNRDVLLQNNLPSLLTNILFFITGGLLIGIIITQHNWIPVSFWWLCLDSTVLLICIYTGKFLFVRFSGWIFHANEAAYNYIFIVFLVNKIIGILFIPLLLLLAFADTHEANILTSICVLVSILLLGYRYIMIFSFLRNNLKINAFHFFVYFCTVEILPMLVIFKVLFNKINFIF